MKRSTNKSSTFEEEGSTSQQEMTQSKVHRESGISSSNAKNNSTSQRDSSGVQNDDDANHSMARQEALKEIEIARQGEDAQQVSRAEIFDQLVAQNEDRGSAHMRNNNQEGTRDIMSAPNGGKPLSIKANKHTLGAETADAIFTQNQLNDFDHTKLPSQQLNQAPVSHVIQQYKNREVMTAPFGQTRGARMYAQGFGQSQNKTNVIADAHLYNNLNNSLDTAQHSDERPPEPSVRRAYRGQALNQQFVESDLLKATNIYQQFDRKGNLFENRLYAKTSINQAKLNKEQSKYEKAMESHPDETCRINPGTTSEEQDMHATNNTGFGRSQMGTVGQNQFNQTGGLSSINKSNNSHSLVNIPRTTQNTDAISPKPLSRKIATRGDRSGRNRTVNGSVNNRMAVTQHSGERCTFSRANGPRIATADMHSNPNKPYGDLPAMNQTMFEKLMHQTNEINKSANLSNMAKSQQNNSLIAAQRSLGKLRSLQGVVRGWSMRDQDLQSVTLGVGGVKKTFQTAQNFMTNDPQFFKMRSVSHNRRLEQMPVSERLKMQGYEHLPYFHCSTPEHEPQGLSGAIKITDNHAIFTTSNLMNRNGKEYYSKMLDGKGRSNVFNFQTNQADDVAAAGLKASRIQKKAYRANTQSNQVDGLYKHEKFTARTNMLNNSRVDFNIIRPNETKDSLKTTYVVSPDYVMNNMRTGKCHQVYGISEFRQNNRLAGIKLHEKYQSTINNDQQTFRRVNGEFTNYADVGTRQTVNK